MLVPDFAHLPLRDASVDSVSILAAINYFDSPDAALREAARVLRPGGVVVITMLAQPVSRVWHMLRDRGLPRVAFSESELREIVSRTDLGWRETRYFMCGLNRLIVLEKA